MTGDAPTAVRKPRWERLGPDERRAQILRIARQLFAARQYAAVSMEEIALAAGVRRGLVNHYFGSKRALFIEVVRDMLASFGRALPPEGAATIADHVSRWLDVVQGDAETWFAILGAEGLGHDRDVSGLVDRATEAMVGAIIDALGEPDSPELRVVLRAYSGLAEVVTREWLQRHRIDRAQAEALLTTALLSLVRDAVPAVKANAGSR
jgi:AcrR family transcriptional regulator